MSDALLLNISGDPYSSPTQRGIGFYDLVNAAHHALEDLFPHQERVKSQLSMIEYMKEYLWRSFYRIASATRPLVPVLTVLDSKPTPEFYMRTQLQVTAAQNKSSRSLVSAPAHTAGASGGAKGSVASGFKAAVSSLLMTMSSGRGGMASRPDQSFVYNNGFVSYAGRYCISCRPIEKTNG